MVKWIEQFLFELTLWIEIPVFVALLLMVIWTIWSLGSFFYELIAQRKNKHTRVHNLIQQNESYIRQTLLNPDFADIHLTEFVRKWEQQENSKLDRVRFLIKAGPSLGLVGTLIPMGQALSALSTGDMAAMSGNMVTAFTSTIIGLTCGTVAYMISLALEKWLNRDFLLCERLLELRLREATTKAKKSKQPETISVN